VSEGTQGDTEKSRSSTRKSRRRAEPPATPPAGPAQTGGSLTRVTANFTPRAVAALDRVSTKTGDSRTDVLNMAVMAYEAVLDLIEEGDGRNLTVKLPDGQVRVVRFIG
jgi:hypothetical protein